MATNHPVNQLESKTFADVLGTISKFSGIIVASRKEWILKHPTNECFPLLTKHQFVKGSINDISNSIYDTFNLSGYHETYLLITRENKMHFGWLPTHCDQFATDWVILTITDVLDLKHRIRNLK